MIRVRIRGDELDSQSLAAAVHVAAHAEVASALGIELAPVLVHGGQPIRWWIRWRRADAVAVALLAGPAAQEQWAEALGAFAGWPPEEEERFGWDVAAARRVLRRGSLSSAQARLVARRLVRRGWPRIEREACRRVDTGSWL